VVFAVLFLLFAYFKADMRIRYIAPIIPPLVILSMYGLQQINTLINERLSASAPRVAAMGVVAIAACMLGMNGGYVWGQFKQVDPLSFLSGRLDRHAYIQKYRPEYAAIKYANENLTKQVKILCIFLGNRRYYSDRELVFGDGFFRKTMLDAERPDNILTDLKERNITHLLIRYDMFNQWTNRQLSQGSKKILGSFFKNQTRCIFSKAGYGLFRL
jgi:hypothetical protein